jgi:tRNA(Ile)-lysidine synthase
MNKGPRAFSAEWLEQRLTKLLPEFPAASLCVAVSGGVDSTVLLAALSVRRHPRTRLRAIHIDHGLNPQSTHWSAHCKAFASSFDVPCKSIRVKVDRSRGTSLEAQARKSRYRVFKQELHDGEVLLTAHHEDDQFETVLLQLLRGAGLPGLAAMPDLTPFGRGHLVRPLLPIPRAALEAWASDRNLLWIDDAMNADVRFDRVYLRRELVPLIKSRWPGSPRSVARTARHIAEAQKLLNALALADIERAMEGESLSVKQLRALSTDRRRNALRFWITQRGAQVPNTARLDELAGPVLSARPEASPKVEWEGAIVQRQNDLLTLKCPKRAGASQSSRDDVWRPPSRGAKRVAALS